MRIEELVLEGFKSYPVRTQITGWDSSFNAITGLNGSGKSNILDAICFVLGLTDMSKLRCQNQQDLIYKRGAAGIVKASVTIVFDNSDKSKSPEGCQDLKQITVTRQIALPNISKYLLNGHKSDQQRIHTLFQSVQLNINNPNFLIQQGRITKVLNMRPQEVLGLVEEAAGTRMFEDRKEKAIRTMSKKEKKVEEITSLLDEEITPKLDNLRAEKRSFLEYQKACTEIERLTRLLKAYQWTEIQKQIEAKEESQGVNDEVIKSLVKSKAQKEKEAKDAEKQKDGIEKRRDKEIEKGGKLKELEAAYETGEKEIARFAAQVEIRQGTIAEEEKKVMEESLSSKRDQVVGLSTSFAAFKESHTTAQQKLASNEELLQTLVTGLSNSASNSNNTAGGGYLAQIGQAKKRLQDAATEEESAKVRLAMLEKEFKEKDARRKETEKEGGEEEKMLNKGRKEVEDLRRAIEATGWSAGKDEEEGRKIQQAHEDVKRLKEQLATLKQQLSQLDFPYSDPSPNFDRSKVKGLVVSLLSLAEAHHDKTTALEMAAGAKLFNVVVQDEKVASQLLNHGKLRKRVTIIPLNKIQGSGPPATKLARAQKLAPGKVDSAISLVGYPEEVSAAMAFVFGQTLVCADNASASLVAYDKEVSLYSVSAEGTAYDPSGVLHGGSTPTGSGILVKAQQIKEVERQLTHKQTFLEGIAAEEHGGGKAKRETWKRLVRELEIKEHEVSLLEQQVGGSNAAKIGAEVETLRKSITELKQTIQNAKARQKDASAECRKLEKDMNDFKDNKDSKLKELKATIAKQKSDLSKNSAAFKQQQKEQQTGQLELEQIETDIKKSFSEVEEAKESVTALQGELAAFQEQIAIYQESGESFCLLLHSPGLTVLPFVQAKHEKITAKLKKERATLTRFDDELAALDQIIKNTIQDIADIDLEKQKAEHEQKTSQGQLAALLAQGKKMESKYPWILEEKQHFGKPGSTYNYNDRGQDIKKMAEKARELEESQKGMSKKVNPKVMNMIDSVEKKEAALKKMLSTVMKDKTKIEKTIEELEGHKREALEKCFGKVTVDFGEIFGELLPGNFAKLVPSDGMDVTQGLDVKVRLGQVWKESLTELSGGQRSLIALSLIMALLQVKPAPMYILDEIDSALDLSHTQHIGQLFRSRFKGSQFIVVSLKEGLFTNANVLFKARFRDGTSVVEV
ncbi:Structural maintenance of chromosomes protein 2 [Tulasnella sp. 331]|nr:Structural maintenance of chromosomes protein 2 [Tulasnella sp. 331]